MLNFSSDVFMASTTKDGVLSVLNVIKFEKLLSAGFFELII